MNSPVKVYPACITKTLQAKHTCSRQTLPMKRLMKGKNEQFRYSRHSLPCSISHNGLFITCSNMCTIIHYMWCLEFIQLSVYVHVYCMYQVIFDLKSYATLICEYGLTKSTKNSSDLLPRTGEPKLFHLVTLVQTVLPSSTCYLWVDNWTITIPKVRVVVGNRLYGTGSELYLVLIKSRSCLQNCVYIR